MIHGDALSVLRGLPERSVHTCVTSPPYWSLRDYNVPATVWGGDTSCPHEWLSPGPPTSCARCGAWWTVLGLEPTPELYVEHVVAIFDEVRRVLRDDGTVWLNLGDCYAAGGRGGDTGSRSGLEGGKRHQEESKKAGQRLGSRSSFRRDRAPRMDVPHKGTATLKPKDLVGVPWMVAFALRAAGWYLRSDIVWAKPNPMPESIKDRPTKSHEYLFLLAKTEAYFYDADAIREPIKPASLYRVRQKSFATQRGGPKDFGRTNVNSNRSSRKTLENFAKSISGGRNRRSVWMISTAPFPGAHFATFPPKLVEPCILAGTSAHGCCSLCGAPFRRIVNLGEPLQDQRARAGADKSGGYRGKATKAYSGAGAQDPSAVKARILEGMRERVTVGWRPTCRHTLREIEPCVVLDPFAGSGTAGMVAQRLGRTFIGIELNPEYVAMAERRPRRSARPAPNSSGRASADTATDTSAPRTKRPKLLFSERPIARPEVVLCALERRVAFVCLDAMERRVALRCWREMAPAEWPHWSVVACVSYSSETRHKGDIYRFDGWRKAGVVRGSTGGGTYSSRKPREDKAVWVYDLPAVQQSRTA